MAHLAGVLFDERDFGRRPEGPVDALITPAAAGVLVISHINTRSIESTGTTKPFFFASQLASTPYCVIEVSPVGFSL